MKISSTTARAVLLCLGNFIFLCWSAAAQPTETGYRAVYVPTFSTNTFNASETVLDNILDSNVNAVFIQVRSRADAYYYPNREDATYPNPEPRGELYAITPSDFDTLQYYIDRCHNADPPVEVHAWLTTYNTWNRTTRTPDSPNHVLNAHPEWITEDLAGTTYTAEDDAPLDPGIPAVREYLTNVFMDVVRNYDIDGIHFDYIRLLSSDSGYDPVAKAQFLAETGWNFDTQNGNGELNEVYEAWRRDQIAQLVQRVTDLTRLEKPWVDTSGFLVNFSDSIEVLGQGYNWWVANDAIDFLSPGCYSSSVAGTLEDWDFYLGKLGQNGDENKIPLVPAVGIYLLEPQESLDAITAFEVSSRLPDGYNFFAYSTLWNDGQASDLFGPGGPFENPAAIPEIPHKISLGEERIPPAPVTQIQVRDNPPTPGVPLIEFFQPSPGADGDFPARYQLYASSDPTVPLVWDNLIMEWWDPLHERDHFPYVDTGAPSGLTYYRIVAFDSWNNSAPSIIFSVNKTTAAISPRPPKEPKPAINEFPGDETEVIVDSHPQALNYDDLGGGSAWATSTLAGYYNSNSRFYSSGNFPLDDYAVWIVDLPRSGRWAIDGWVRNNVAFAEGAQYRFVDRTGTVRNTAVSQRTSFNDTQSGAWAIDVDGVDDENAYKFDAGRVYVTVYGNTAGSQTVVADALRFRYLAPIITDGLIVK